MREGRRGEFAEHGWGASDVPDPTALSTFEDSRLDWTEPDREPHAWLLGVHRELIALRRAHPELADPHLDRVRVDADADARTLVVHRGDPAAGGQPGRRPGDAARGGTRGALRARPASTRPPTP